MVTCGFHSFFLCKKATLLINVRVIKTGSGRMLILYNYARKAAGMSFAFRIITFNIQGVSIPQSHFPVFGIQQD